MTNVLYAGKRSRACRTCKKTGIQNCAAAKLNLASCDGGECRGMNGPLVDTEIQQQREYLTRHLRPRSKSNSTTKLEYRPSCPRRCHWIDEDAGIRKCRAALPCPPGRCCASYLEVASEADLHEYAQLHGRDGVGNFWELGALSALKVHVDPGRLDDREDMVRARRASLTRE